MKELIERMERDRQAHEKALEKKFLYNLTNNLL